MRPSIVLLIVIASVAFSCGDIGESKRETETNPLVPITSPSYVPGHVVVGFADSVDYRFIISFVDGLNLIALSTQADSSFGMWIQVDSGEVDQHLARLEKDSAVGWAERRGYDGGDPQKSYILAYFLSSVRIEYALSLVASIGGISWKRTIIPPRSALLKVKIGQEKRWVETLKTFSFVRWAELDYLIEVQPQ